MKCSVFAPLAVPSHLIAHTSSPDIDCRVTSHTLCCSQARSLSFCCRTHHTRLAESHAPGGFTSRLWPAPSPPLPQACEGGNAGDDCSRRQETTGSRVVDCGHDGAVPQRRLGKQRDGRVPLPDGVWDETLQSEARGRRIQRRQHLYARRLEPLVHLVHVPQLWSWQWM